MTAQIGPVGYLDFRWQAQQKPHTPGRWQVVGTHPDATVPAVEVDVVRRPGFVTAEDIAVVIAELLNGFDNGAAALMLADYDHGDLAMSRASVVPLRAVRRGEVGGTGDPE